MNHRHRTLFRYGFHLVAFALATTCAACGGAIASTDPTGEVNGASTVEGDTDAGDGKSAENPNVCHREKGGKEAHGKGPRPEKRDKPGKPAEGEEGERAAKGGKPKGPPPPDRSEERGPGDKATDGEEDANDDCDDDAKPPPPPRDCEGDEGPHGGAGEGPPKSAANDPY